MGQPPSPLAGRYRIDKELVAEEDLRRWTATDTTDGSVVEVIAPRAHALLREGALDTFSQSANTHPAFLATLARTRVDGIPYLVRPATRGTLAGVRLTPGEARALVGWLAPALRGAQGACGGDLRAEDIAIDIAGHPRIARIELPRPGSLSRIPFQRAPEAMEEDSPPDAAGDLFGLGVIVYRAITGAEPWPATSPNQLRHRAHAAPPLSDHLAIPAGLDAAVTGLLSLDPVARLLSAESIEPGPPPVLSPPPLHDAPTAQRALATRSTLPSHPNWVVVTPLAGGTPTTWRRVAVRTGVEFEAVERAAASGGDWVLDVAESEGEASRLARRAEAQGLVARAQATHAPAMVQWFLVALVATLAGFFVPFPLGGVFWVAAGLILLQAARNVGRSLPVSRARTALRLRQQAPTGTGPEIRALAFARRVRQAEHVPAALRADLREAIDAGLERLMDLAAAEAELPKEARGAIVEEREGLSHAFVHAERVFAQVSAEATRSPQAPELGDAARALREQVERAR